MSTEPVPAPRCNPGRAGRASGWAVVAIALVIGAVGGLHRAFHDRPDWQPLAQEVRYVWENKRTAPGTAMFGYLPAATFALLPFMAWLPLPAGATLYVLSNVAAAVASLYVVWRWWGMQRCRLFVVAALLCAANFAHAITANQLTLWTLLLCVAGLALAERRHELAGGALLGLATVVKTMPALLLGYILLRRRWRAAVGMLLGLLLFDALPSIVYFGWRGAWQEHRSWLRRVEWHSNTRQIEQPLLRAHKHKSNFAWSAVLARWLRGKPQAESAVVFYGEPPPQFVERARAALGPDEILLHDPMPPREGTWRQESVDLSWVPHWHLASLSAETVWWIWLVSVAAATGALSWATWKSSRQPGADWAALAALWLLAMFWLSPMARHYYLALAFPAVAVVWSQVVELLRQRGLERQPTGPLTALTALAVWVVGCACLGWSSARWYGVHMAAIFLLAIATARAARRSRCRLPV